MNNKEKLERYALFKYNGGLGALLCSKCGVIIKTGKDFTEEEWKAARGEMKLPSRWCQECLDKAIINYPII